MGTIKDGISANRKGRSRPILTLWGGSNGSDKTAQLDGDELHETNDERPKNQSSMSAVERFEAALWAARNEWDIGRRSLPQSAEDWVRGGGFAGIGRISKVQAGKLWDRAKADFAKVGAR